MPRKGENIYKRKDGRWEGRYIKSRSEKGRAVYGYVYAKSYGEVKQKVSIARVVQEKSAVGQLPILVNSTEFCDLANEWLYSMRPQIKMSTYVKYRNMIRSYISMEFKNTEIREMTIECISSHCNKLLTCGGTQKTGLSPKTVSDILSLIRNILRYAQSKGIQVPCSGKEIVIKQASKEMNILSRSVQAKLCHYLYEHATERNMGILLCLFTGLRIGEVCALKWEDISLKDGTVHVHQTMQRVQVEGNADRKTVVIITTPKSKCSIRTIPIPKHIVLLLEQSISVHHGFLLTGSDNKYVEPRTLQNHFQRVLKENSIEPVNFHALRHTFATRCVEVGFDIKSLSEILGHASVNITMNRYVHPSMELKQENMQRLSSLFSVK